MEPVERDVGKSGNKINIKYSSLKWCIKKKNSIHKQEQNVNLTACVIRVSCLASWSLRQCRRSACFFPPSPTHATFLGPNKLGALYPLTSSPQSRTISLWSAMPALRACPTLMFTPRPCCSFHSPQQKFDTPCSPSHQYTDVFFNWD